MSSILQYQKAYPRQVFQLLFLAISLSFEGQYLRGPLAVLKTIRIWLLAVCNLSLKGQLGVRR